MIILFIKFSCLIKFFCFFGKVGSKGVIVIESLGK